MEFALGVIAGLVLAVIVFLATLRFNPEVNRVIKQTSSKVQRKGQVFEPESNELKGWLDELPNEEKKP